ncbi:FecR family protein [Peristeroidobacter soli]|uniref:FecR family protein n=1 Tax=Peristeroidobacter soli TaxID=2497877 RepID=UPI00101D7525|nr:FecR domain-containing protein [Peristeroidobacter soli]
MSRETSRESTNSQILAEASEWLIEFEAGEPDSDTRREFDDWLRQSPEHVRAYLGLLPLWKQGSVAKFSRDQGPESLIAYANTEGNVVALTGSAQPGQRSRTRTHWPAAMAATIAFVVVGGLFAWREFQAPLYTTGIGEQRSVLLPDGSTLELNARSRVRIEFTEKQRGIDLLQGQALFHVVADAHRPFVVSVDTLSVRAVGTQFDVNRRASGTIVTVVEGRVSILEPSPSGGAEASRKSFLSAGEQVTVSTDPANQPKQSRTADAAAATAWTQRRLVFDASTLSEVVEEFNRYNVRPIKVVDASLDGFPITGSFSSTDSASLLRFLEAQPGIQVTTADDEIRVALRK